MSSVILCTRNRPDDIIACLNSLAIQTCMPTEIMVVDSSDVPLNTIEFFSTLFTQINFPDTQLTYLHTKPGLTIQRNIGIGYAQGEIIYFFDDDVILEPDYIQQMNIIFESHPEYAGGMGDITNITRSNWRYRFFRTIFLLPREGASGNFTWSGMPTHAYGTKEFKRVEVLGGCCMAYRAEILKHYMFDEKLSGYAYMEDCDVSRRISYDYPLFFNPKARLQHLASPIARDRIVANSAMFIRNYRYLFNKNFYSRNKWKTLPQYWSIAGLFLEAGLTLSVQKIKGYQQGLLQSWHS